MRPPHNDLLTRALAKRFSHLSAAEITRLSGLVFDMMMDAVAAGKRVEIRSFGVFYLGTMERRMMRNPGSGEMMEVSARKRPRFRAGSRLRNMVNRGPL